MTDLKTEFWTRMSSVRSGMLGIKGHGRLVAMSPHVDKDLPGSIWFVTANSTELGKSVAMGEQSAQLVLSDDAAGLYADIEGTLSHSSDKQELDEIWNSVASAWFDKGKEDPDVCLMQFVPSVGEIAVTTTSGVKFLYQIAKANLTGDDPDVGSKGTVTF